MNILLTCAGRRSYLAKYFKDALKERGSVFTANSTAVATSMVVSDGAIVAPPLINEERYIDFLKKICKKLEVKLVVSLFDMELPILARHREEIEKIGARVAISSPDVIEICNDKVKTGEFCNNLGLSNLFTTVNLNGALEAIRLGTLNFPLYIKPRFGMGSLAMQQADNAEELQILFSKVKNDLDKSYLKYHHAPSTIDELVIIQESAAGQEYGLDIINDFDGNYVTTFVKKKIAMRSGETDIAETENRQELIKLGKIIGKSLKHAGILDVDVFWAGKQPIVLEMNARFGGGYPFSHLAGANIPKAYIGWAKGEKDLENCFGIKYGVRGLKELNLLDYHDIKLIQPYE